MTGPTNKHRKHKRRNDGSLALSRDVPRFYQRRMRRSVLTIGRQVAVDLIRQLSRWKDGRYVWCPIAQRAVTDHLAAKEVA